MNRYTVLTDAASDLSPALCKGYDVEVIPMSVEIGSDMYYYGGSESAISCDTFYRLQAEGHTAHTSQITPAVFRSYFEKYLKAGIDIVYLGFSSGLSGTYQSACLAAEELQEEYPERKLICVDTLCASIGQAFLVLEALDRQKQGYTPEELARWAGSHVFHADHWFTVDTLTYLAQGGRISSAAASMGNLLQVKPLIRLDEEGKLTVFAKPRGNKQAFRGLLKRMEEHWLPEEGKRVIIGHGHARDKAEELQRMVKERFPEAKTEIAEIGPIIGTHTGPGMLALVFWGDIR